MISLLRLVRLPNLIIIALLQSLIRYGLILPILNYYGYDPVLSHFRFGLLVLATACLAASGYVINDYFDIKIDRLNRPQKMVIDNGLKRREAMFLHVILTFVGVFTGLFLSYVARKETWALLFLAIPLILWYYSTTFKKQGFIGNLVVSGLTALVTIVVVSLEFAMLERVHGSAVINSEACSTAWFWTLGFAFFAFVTTLIREVVKDMEDLYGDEKGGCRTLPIEIGIKYAKIFVLILTCGTLSSIWGLYFYIDILNNSSVTLWYILCLITLPFLWSTYLLFKSDTPKAYHRLSTWYKLIMLAGILFILVARQLF
ncbi:4-hydroxybenzoate polyprenyltransferase [Saccharicrinis carchari]|uniref:4-hydroxybenzoate polyprenyltransferase n=1 Tax=Saccharicrinis carchari TaxID=1168039 RepID=A0A521DNY8_SACCC|nr:geranylgeranylglycerol-phosphate geranylgeranyltransferase [Saccharicrinis carchari]SMO73447.1 4-hydroxybenzoate polyprenyltransferase [Saccharicrinis carchari]